MKINKPVVTVAILTKNAGDRFYTVLKNVFTQVGVAYEVLVIDSGSTDNTLTISRRYPVRLVSIKSIDFGHGKTRNLAARLAKGKYVVFLTHDAIPKGKNWLSNLIKPLENKTVAGVFGRQVPRANENILDKMFFLSLYGTEKIVWTPGSYSSGDNIFSDANSAIKRSLLLKHPYRNDIIVSEDYEWANRVMNQGFSIVYEPSAQVIHSHSYNIYSLFKRNFDIGISYKQITNFNNGSNFLLKGLKLFQKEISGLVSEGKPTLIASSFIRNAVRFIAIMLGKNEALLPKYIKRNYLSAQRWYWI